MKKPPWPAGRPQKREKKGGKQGKRPLSQQNDQNLFFHTRQALEELCVFAAASRVRVFKYSN
jgi:hypothetical protein